MFAFLLGLAVIVQPGPRPPAAPTFTPPPAPPMARPSPHDPASVMRLFSADDYPREAMRLEQQGTVTYRAIVGTDGRVTRCEVETSSGSASLDSATCSIIQRRARFRPARDQHGRPIEDKFSGRIRWVLPEPDPTPFADQRKLVIFTADSAGSVKSCRQEGNERGASSHRICPALWPVAQKIVADSKRGLGMVGQELVLEQGLLVGGPDSANFIGQGRGETLIKRAAIALTIDGGGKVIDCVAVPYDIGAGDTPNDCERGRRLGFLPLGADATDPSSRHAVRYMATYMRPQR